MFQKFWKTAAAAGVIAAFLAVSISRLPFTTVSPDAIRFMHFAQINADRAVSEGATVKSAVAATLRTVKGMNNYDLNRGRLVQGLAFGVEGMTRWMFPSSLNLLMILLMACNSALAARLATRDVEDSRRISLGLLAWVTLATTSVVLSPVMLVTLYGKYVWITFILAHFLARRTGWKVFWLLPAAYSDEIGLFAVALIAFFHIGRETLKSAVVHQDPGNQFWRIVRSIATGMAAALNVILVFFGTLAIVFDAGAGTFSSFAQRGLKGAAVNGSGAWEVAHGILWRGEVVLLGFSTKVNTLTALAGGALILVVAMAIGRRVQELLRGESGGWARLRSALQFMVVDRTLSFYMYWSILLIVISWLILPGHVYDLNQYSYPAAIVLGLLFTKAVADLIPARAAIQVMTALVAVHLIFLPRIADQTATTIVATLLPDGTVTVEDVRKLHRTADDIRRTGKSALLDSINNNREIDFSGTWYYSRVRAFGIATQPHWPVQGTVRVLSWPTHVQFKCLPRTFLYTRAAFEDKPCATN